MLSQTVSVWDQVDTQGACSIAPFFPGTFKNTLKPNTVHNQSIDFFASSYLSIGTVADFIVE